jgi:hypothetical protein
MKIVTCVMISVPQKPGVMGHIGPVIEISSKRPNRVGVSPLTWGWKHPVSETFSSFLNTGGWAKSTNPLILSVTYHRQNSLKSNSTFA